MCCNISIIASFKTDTYIFVEIFDSDISDFANTFVNQIYLWMNVIFTQQFNWSTVIKKLYNAAVPHFKPVLDIVYQVKVMFLILLKFFWNNFNFFYSIIYL